jgi:hypothetical protein
MMAMCISWRAVSLILHIRLRNAIIETTLDECAIWARDEGTAQGSVIVSLLASPIGHHRSGTLPPGTNSAYSR